MDLYQDLSHYLALYYVSHQIRLSAATPIRLSGMLCTFRSDHFKTHDTVKFIILCTPRSFYSRLFRCGSIRKNDKRIISIYSFFIWLKIQTVFGFKCFNSFQSADFIDKCTTSKIITARQVCHLRFTYIILVFVYHVDDTLYIMILYKTTLQFVSYRTRLDIKCHSKCAIS